MNELKILRKKIDIINDELKKALIKRKKIVLKIREIKKENNIKTLDKKRENEIFEELELKDKYLIEIFKKIIEESRRIQG